MKNATTPANGEAMPATLSQLVARHFAFAEAYRSADFGADPVAGERTFLATADTAASAALMRDPPPVASMLDLTNALSFLSDMSNDAPGKRRILELCMSFLDDQADAAEAQPDADLIRLGAGLEAAWAVQDEAERADGDEGASFDRAYEACRTIAERIIATPALTLDGMRVKARVVAWCHSGQPFADDSFDGATTDLRMVASLLSDLLGSAPRS